MNKQTQIDELTDLIRFYKAERQDLIKRQHNLEDVDEEFMDLEEEIYTLDALIHTMEHRVKGLE